VCGRVTSTYVYGADGGNWIADSNNNPAKFGDADGRAWSPPLMLLGLLSVLLLGLGACTGSVPLMVIGALLLVIDVVLTIWWAYEDLVKPLRERIQQQQKGGLASISTDQLDRMTGAIETLKGASGPAFLLCRVSAATLEQLLWIGIAEG
jgi:hypothetical protein